MVINISAAVFFFFSFFFHCKLLFVKMDIFELIFLYWNTNFLEKNPEIVLLNSLCHPNVQSHLYIEYEN